jgi:hypothetical protein
MNVDVGSDGGDELFDILEDSLFDRGIGRVAGESFNHVVPRTECGSLCVSSQILIRRLLLPARQQIMNCCLHERDSAHQSVMELIEMFDSSLNNCKRTSVPS